MPFKPVIPADAAEELTSHLEFLEEVVEARESDVLRLANVCEEFSTHYRALGICRLTESADIDGFFDYLIQSALARRHYLRDARKAGGGDPRYLRASFIDPALDAIAARQWKLATEVLDLASHEWLQGEEYEDDFCYADAIRGFVTGEPKDIDGLLARWKEVLEGGEDLRLDVVTALRLRDDDAFSASLRRLLQWTEANAREIADPVDGSLLADEATFFPNRWISVEALALLAIAERRGITIEEEIPFCPGLVRSAAVGDFRSRGYPSAPHEIER